LQKKRKEQAGDGKDKFFNLRHVCEKRRAPGRLSPTVLLQQGRKKKRAKGSVSSTARGKGGATDLRETARFKSEERVQKKNRHPASRRTETDCYSSWQKNIAHKTKKLEDKERERREGKKERKKGPAQQVETGYGRCRGEKLQHCPSEGEMPSNRKTINIHPVHARCIADSPD